MNVGMLSPQQLRSLVEDKWQRDLAALAFGLHVAPSWHAPGEVEFEFGKARVVRADTVFQIREALLSAETANDRIVVLTRLQQHDLGHDVVGRLARSKLFAVNHWASLCSLFKAKELEHSICVPAIAQALLEHRPSDGYPPVSAGLLDAGTVWRAICRHVFDMGEREPDLVSLLLWAASEKGTERYQQAGKDICPHLRHRLMHNLGEAADSILQFIEHGAGPDALALAVVCQVVFGSGDDSVLDAAAARMEQYHGNQLITKPVGRTLGRVAVDAIADLDRHDDPRIAQQHLQRADELMKQFVCDQHAYRNTLSRLSFEQRLGRLGHAIRAAISGKGVGTQLPERPSGCSAQLSPDPVSGIETIADCELRLGDIAEHRLAKLGRNKDQVSKAEMAVRLVRWLSQNAEQTTASSFILHASASDYIQEISFVDWAREPLCRGEESPDPSSAYQLLDQTILQRREEISRTFAKSLADWSAVGSNEASVLGVEDVLSKIVSRVVGQGNRVLLVVLDGMSWAVCHELLEDIRQDHWFESTLDESGTPPAPVIATIPSVTNFSRASLLSGTFTKGDQNVEKKNFEANIDLAKVCDRRYPPKLFHKHEITEGNRGAISDGLSKKLLSAQYKVVGVVINAIDDRLNNAQQVIDNWSISRISPLRALLRLARDSGRVVIFASDHGHVWHRPDGQYRAHEEANRWRSNDGSLVEDEIVLSGGRVLVGDQSVIVPWSERVYYKGQQNGYHGGATPQEMVCPLVLLTDKTSAYTGLYPCAYPKPDWWSAAPVASLEIEAPTLTITVPQKVGSPTLFDMTPEEEQFAKPAKDQKTAAAGADWITALLKCPVYEHQKAMIRRHPVEDACVQACLSALEANGGIMTPAGFAKAADVPMARLDGLVVKMQRVLNVDGYEILTLDRNENRVELNAAKLKRQFDLD